MVEPTRIYVGGATAVGVTSQRRAQLPVAGPRSRSIVEGTARYEEREDSMARRSIGGFGIGRLLLIGAIVCFVLQLLQADVGIDLVTLGLALGFGSFLL